MTSLAFASLFIISLLAYALNARAARSILTKGTPLHSVPAYHGNFAFLLVALPALVFTVMWLLAQTPVIDWWMLREIDTWIAIDGSGSRDLSLAEIKSIAAGQVFGEPAAWKMDLARSMVRVHALASTCLLTASACLAGALLIVARRKVHGEFRARQAVETIMSLIMVGCSVVAIFTTVGIIASLLFETLKFLSLVPLREFLFGLNWEPQIPIRDDQVAAVGAFGWVPVILGTLVITVVALLIAVPVGLMSAIYLNEFAPRTVRAVSKPVLEILAGVPTVVYGFFAILVIAPALRQAGMTFGLGIAPNTALAAGGVMGIMLIPFISSFADDALSSVPQSLHDGALALGATRSEVMLGVMFPAAIPGIAGGILLAVSRAIGETMIVVMAAGLIARLTINPLDSVTTVTVQIVTLLIGDTSFDNPKTLAAFALGMMLFLVTLMINVLALRIVKKYREVYE